MERKIRPLEARIDALTEVMRLLVDSSPLADDTRGRRIEEILSDVEAGNRARRE